MSAKATPSNERMLAALTAALKNDVESMRSFLTDGGLYSSVSVTPSTGLPDAISQPCGMCSSEPTTTWKSTHFEQTGDGARATFTCVHCGKATVRFWVLIRSAPSTETGVSKVYTKVGQYPAPSTRVPPAVNKAFKKSKGAHELYKKALFCLANGYGIGALAYLRRVVDGTVGELLEMIASSSPDDATLAEGVERARGSKSAAERLKLVAPLVPASLKVGGVNPLALLYDHYSAGLHAASDAECAEAAEELRQVFEYVHVALRDQIEQARAFASSVLALAHGKK